MDQAVGAARASVTAPAAPPPDAATPGHLLVARGVDKSFGGTHAVRTVDFDVPAAEVVALLGGNGAGKSTLMKILGGLVAADAGRIELAGRSLGPDHSPAAAMALGLRFVHQELSLAPNLRIFESFAVAMPDVIRGLRWKAAAIERARGALEAVFPGAGVDPRAKVGALPLAQRQMVEIACAANHPDARLLILDEPTSSLGSREAEHLRDFVRRRRDAGVSFVFITHRLHEALEVADRLTVMRNGRVAWSGAAGGISQRDLIELLGGQPGGADTRAPARAEATRAAAVRVDRLATGAPGGVSLVARRGEILGLAGLEGGGQPEILRAIYAMGRGAGGGAVAVEGRVAFVSGDRAAEGVFPLWSVDENIAASSLGRLTRWGLIDPARLGALTRGWFDRLGVRAASGAVPITALSGGNQQKVVIARALAAEAEVVLLDDPTRGVDLGTKAELYALFRALAAQGSCLIWHSTDDSEFAHCDRTLVLRDGAIVAEFARADLSQQRLVEASFRRADGDGAPHAQLAAERARRREALVAALIPLVTFAAVFALCAALNPRILSTFGLTLIFSAAFALAFAATSQLFVIAAGDIDLGLGAFIGLVNAVAATWLVSDPWLAALALAAMLAAYPVMGLFIEARRVPAIVVTLGLSFVWLGLAALRLPRAGGSSPDWLVDLLRLKPPLVPLPLLLCALPAVVAHLVLFVWRYGAVLRGYGANPAAIAAAGWSTRFAKATLYGFAGLFAVLAGVLVTASTRGGDPTGSASMTLLSVAAVILGGAAFAGGVVSPVGAVFGTLTLVLVGTLLSLLGVNAVFLPMVQGLLLLGVIGARTLLLGRPSP